MLLQPESWGQREGGVTETSMRCVPYYFHTMFINWGQQGPNAK